MYKSMRQTNRRIRKQTFNRNEKENSNDYLNYKKHIVKHLVIYNRLIQHFI
jgi:hypothetical protein